MTTTEPEYMRRICPHCSACGEHQLVGQTDAGDLVQCANCARVHRDTPDLVPGKGEPTEAMHRRVLAKPLPAPAQPAAGALEAQAIVDRADDEQRMHGDVAVALADSAARYLAPASSGLAASEAKRRGNGTPPPMPAVEPGERNDDISRAQPDDDERAQRWVKHMLGGAFTGDWEDRYAAVRVLAALRERAEAAERAAWENLRLLGEREVERDLERDFNDVKEAALVRQTNGWIEAERRLADLTKAAREATESDSDPAFYALTRVLDRHAREGAQETPLCLRTGSPAPQQDTTVSGGLCECEHCDLVRSRVLRERPPLTPTVAAPEPPDGALTAAHFTQLERRLAARDAEIAEWRRKLDLRSADLQAATDDRDAEIARQREALQVAANECAKLREQAADAELQASRDRSVLRSALAAAPEPARVDESELRKAGAFLLGYTDEHFATLRERGYGALAVDLRALREALAAEPAQQVAYGDLSHDDLAAIEDVEWSAASVVAKVFTRAQRGQGRWAEAVVAQHVLQCIRRDRAQPEPRASVSPHYAWTTPAQPAGDNSRDVARHLAAAADAVQERALAVEGRCLLHDDVDYDYATRQWLENTARELRMAERDLRARAAALRDAGAKEP